MSYQDSLILPVVWPDWFWARLGGNWPDIYLAIDVETTGLRLQPDLATEQPADLITEVGYCFVVDNRIDIKGSVLVDWTQHPGVDPKWLKDRLQQRDDKYEIAGKSRPTDFDRLRELGFPPKEVFEFLYLWLSELCRYKIPVFAHNGYRFDEPHISRAFEILGICNNFSFGPDTLWDTCAIEIGNEVLVRQDIDKDLRAKIHPSPDDTMRTYCNRLVRLKAPKQLNPLTSNLDNHCYVKYKFAEDGVTQESLHNAETDSFCVHLLVERWKKWRKQESDPFTDKQTNHCDKTVKDNTFFSGVLPQQKRYRGVRII